MKKILKIALKSIIVVIFIYIGTVAVCGFNMMQTTSMTLSLTNTDKSITGYNLDFKNGTAYITEYDIDGYHPSDEKITITNGEIFRIKAVCAFSFVPLWGERFYDDSGSERLWSLSRTRTDVDSISSGNEKHPFTYEYVENEILMVFEDQ